MTYFNIYFLIKYNYIIILFKYYNIYIYIYILKIFII